MIKVKGRSNIPRFDIFLLYFRYMIYLIFILFFKNSEAVEALLL